MTKEILNQVENGIIPSDKDLQTAIDFFTELESSLRIMGERYFFCWQDSFHRLDQLNGYKQARISSGKWKLKED